MTLSAGTRLGLYEIISSIGAGGMGEVYRARDSKLGREVAIKVLPETVAPDADRLARFDREAQLLAALNHPNIAAIYGLEDRALIMELVEGATLADRIAQGPIPLEQASLIINQLVDALEYAHEKGVVHRDLKPANIKITPEGRVKVLDFGLAKALSNETAPADPVSSPTLTMRATMAGVIMGTAAYMAPEQARGQNVDKRADIWAFGVLVYEMLTGHQLFAGPTVSDTLAAVLKEEPDVSLVPAPLRRLVRLCLVKDPRRRMRDIGDARIILAEAPETSAVEPVRSRLPWAIAAVISLVAVFLGVALWRATRPVEHPLLSLSVDLGPDAVRGRDTTAVLSPDGSRIVFPVRTADGKQALAIRRLSELKAAVLPGTNYAINPFFSPDGQWIGYFADGKLKKISAQGGAAVTLCNAPAGRGGAWGEDGYIVSSLSTGGVLFRIPEAGGPPQPLTKPDEGEATHRWPQILPRSQALLYTANKGPGEFDDANIRVLSFKTGQRKTVVRGGYFGRYLPGGHLLYVHQGTLFGVPFDLEKLEVKGVPTPLVEDVAANVDFGGGQFDFSLNGTLVYLSGKASGGTQGPLLWMDSTGRTQPLLSTTAHYVDVCLSPDGRRLAIHTLEAGETISVYDIERSTLMKLTFGGHSNRSPVWAPDGKHIVYLSQLESGFALMWIRADGAGEPQRLWQGPSAMLPYSFSPDGRRLAFSESTAETNNDIWTLPLDTSEPDHPKPGKPEVFLRTPLSESLPAISPDGRWMAYVSNEAGSLDIYVRPFAAGSPASGGKWQISTDRGLFPVWSRATRQLLYEAYDPTRGVGRIMAADYTVEGDSFHAGKPRPWVDKPFLSPFGRIFDVVPDGKRIVLQYAEAPANEPNGNLHVIVLVNFFDELRRRVSADK